MRCVRVRDIAAHGVDLVCVDAGHDRLHAFGPTITVRIGAVEQGYMGRRVSELDLLEHSLPYVGGQKIGTAGQSVAEVEEDRSEERPLGEECVLTCRFRWSPYYKNKKDQ